MRLRNITATADGGLSFVGGPRWQPAYEGAMLRPDASDGRIRVRQVPPPVTGFTAPTITYDLMRQIQTRAEALDLNVQRYVADPIFRQAWNAWYDEAWEPFFERYAGPDYETSARLGAAFYSDELAQRTEEFRRQLESFYADYAKQRQPSGQPVPSAGAPPPHVRPQDLAAASGRGFFEQFQVPWWGWALGGLIVVGLGYVAYRYLTAPLSVLKR